MGLASFERWSIMTKKSRNENADSLVLLGVFILVLMFLLSWSFRVGNVVAGSFQVDNVQICDELDEKMNPLHPGKDFPGGSKQVCLRFNYSKGRVGDSLKVVWNYEGRSIQEDVFRISEPKGFKAFCLLREDGSSLPSGGYSVEIFCNGRERSVQVFGVLEASADVLLGSGDLSADWERR